VLAFTVNLELTCLFIFSIYLTVDVLLAVRPEEDQMWKIGAWSILIFCAGSLFSQPGTKTHDRHLGGHWHAAVYANGSFLNIGLLASNSIEQPTISIPCHDRAPKMSVHTHRWIVRGGERLTWSIRFDDKVAEFRSVMAEAHRSTVSEVPLLEGDLNQIIHAKKVELAVRFYPNTHMTTFSFFPEGLDLRAAESSCPNFRAAL
jgi:hypothetical protein